MSRGPAAAILGRLPDETRVALTRRSDRAGLLHLAGHLGLLIVLGGIIVSGVPGWWLALLPHGIALAFLFTLQHEATHQTPFESRLLNEAVGHATGLVLIQPFLWFRAFHMAHHRHTNDPQNDPELAGGDARPRTKADLLRYLSTLGYWRGKLVQLWTNAFGTPDSSYVSARALPRIRREAQAMLVIYLGAILAMVTIAPTLFWVWLLPLALGFPVLRFYLLAEHDRCEEVADMLRNSRTTLTTRAVRFLAWNMPFHAEHHAWPQVPFHQLPKMHEHARSSIATLTPGYTTFAAETVSNLRQ